MKENTKKTLKIYWQAAGGYKPSGWLMLVTLCLATGLDVVIPLYYKQFFDYLAGSGPRDLLVRGLIATLMIIAALSFLQWLLWRVTSFAATHFQTRIIADLSNKCFAYLHRHSFSYFNNNFSGSLVKRVKWFTSAFEAVADKVTWNLLPLAINIFFIAIILLGVNIYLGLGVIVWVVIFLILSWAFTKYKLKYDIRRSETETETTGLLADTITNNANVKLFNGYGREVESFAQVTERLRRLRNWCWNLGNIFEAMQGFLMVVMEIGIFYFAILLWQKNALTIGGFVLIQSYILNIFTRVWDFGRTLRNIYEHLADAEEMTVILNTPQEIQDIPGAKNLKVTTGKIEFKDVTFNYNETRSILKNFNLLIEPQARLAVIGPSGAGKTTIIKLLFRMHDVTGGQILIDGQDIARVTQESLWQNISLVPQDPILFHRTLMENIRYGKPKATDDEVVEAAKAAHCHEFISSLSEGYNTFVGERGIKLSGGERQRVAIARAILRNAPILVLDEATSSLDSHSEKLIQDALDKLMKEKTVIVIAHRLSTIRKMDRIIAVDKGGIVEDGSHDELLKKPSGVYSKLWKLQAGGFIK